MISRLAGGFSRVLVVMVWLSAGATLVGFTLPWAHLDVREPGVIKELRTDTPLSEALGDLGRIAVKIRRGAETVAGELPSLRDIPKQVSGAQIPQMANDERAKVVVALAELVTDERQHLGAKSYAVYLLPGLAVLAALLLTVWGGRLPVVIGTTLVCALIAGVGWWKLLTTNTQTLFIAITIGHGLWLSLWGYVGLAVAGLATLALHRRQE